MNLKQLIRKNGDGSIEVVTLEQLNGVDMLVGQKIRRRKATFVWDLPSKPLIVTVPPETTEKNKRRRAVTRCRACVVYGVQFDTILDAARHFRMAPPTVGAILRDGLNPDFRFV